MNLLDRLGHDVWPLDQSTVGANLVASLLWALIVGLVLYVFWPRLRRAVNGVAAKALHNHHLLHVAPHHDAVAAAVEEVRTLVAGVHARLDQLFAHLSEPTLKEAPMGILSELASSIENRFRWHPPATDQVAEAHAKIRTLFEDTAKSLIEIAGEVSPQAHEIEVGLQKLEEAAMWVHAHIARNQVVPAAPADPAPVDPPADPVTPAPVDPAPPADPAPAPVDPPAPVDAPVDPAPVPDVPIDPAAPHASTALFLFSGDPATVDLVAWPLADVATASGQALYNWAGGDGPAPAAKGWSQFVGTTVPRPVAADPAPVDPPADPVTVDPAPVEAVPAPPSPADVAAPPA